MLKEYQSVKKKRRALIGIVMSVILATFSGGILRIVSIAPALLEPAEIYLRIVGGACFLNALIPIFSR